MRVVSLPSEKVPAPPSPNWMLAFSSSSPVAEKCSTARTRSARAGPRSSTRGAKPCWASASAAKSPAGPSPQTTGRLCSRSVPGVRTNCAS